MVAGYFIVGFGARAVSRKTPTYFIIIYSMEVDFSNVSHQTGTIGSTQC